MGMKGNTFRLGKKSGERDVKYIRVMLGDAATQASVPYSPPAGSCWLYCVDSHNTYGGTGACTNLTAPGGDDNTVLGFNAMYYNAAGDKNVAIGSGAAYGETGRDIRNNVIIGYNAGHKGDRVYESVIIGCEAGYNVDYPSSDNVFIGYQSGYRGGAGAIFNVFIGYQSGYETTEGNENVFLGYAAGLHNTSGAFNVAIGTQALEDNQTGNSNVAIGNYAGIGRTGDPYQNVLLGAETAYELTDGYDNVIIGFKACNWSFTDGHSNVIIGPQAGYNLATGSGNVFIGHDAAYNETGSNKLYIENSNADSANALIYGEFDNDILVFNADVTFGGTMGAIEISVVAGDPVIIFDIGGTDKFTIGVDDSDGDKFKISDGGALGASDRYTLDSTGIHTFGDGGTTNYAQIAADGEVTLAGTARVTTAQEFTSSAWADGANAPAATNTGDYSGEAYTINDSSLVAFRVPDNMDLTVNPAIRLYWYINEAFVTNSGEVQWACAYSAAPANASEAVDGAGYSGDLDPGDVNIPATAKYLTYTDLGTLTGASLTAGDILGLEFSRVALDGGNNPAVEPVAVLLEFRYTASKLGTAT